jgi:hypothetical protein
LKFTPNQLPNSSAFDSARQTRDFGALIRTCLSTRSIDVFICNLRDAYCAALPTNATERLPFYAVGDAEVLYKLPKLRSAAVQRAGAFTQRNQLDSQSIGACAGRTGSLASELNTGLLVVGGHSRGPWREAVFGGVITTLVDHAECPAFMMH